MHHPDDTNILRVDPLLELDVLSPGLRGYTVEVDGALYVPLVVADKPGQGALRRYLDSLPRDRIIKFPTVINGFLREALLRRGFVLEYEWSNEHQQMVELYVRRPAP